MTRPVLWKRALAVPAALSLALGGALLASAPASAAPGDPVAITSPTEGSVVDGRTFTVSGTGSDGATVALIGDGGNIVASAVVAAGGAWSVPVTYPADAAEAQTIDVAQAIDPLDESTITTDTVSFTLPAADETPVDPQPLVVTSPEDGATLDSRFATFTGTATLGSTVTALVAGTPVGSGTADENGAFEFEAGFPFELDDEVTVVVTATAPDGTEATPVTLQLTLPPAIDAPVITSPVTGSTITGQTVTISGTGVAGVDVTVAIVPTDLLNPAFEEVDPEALIPSTVVSADGTWSVSTTLPLAEYVAVAVHTTSDDDVLEAEFLSGPSNEVVFTLAAAVAPAPGGTGQLAATGGADGNALPAAAAALMVLSGAALIVLRRQRGLVG